MSKVDIQEFARDVERLCDFLLDKVEKNGTSDVAVIQKLKDTAATIQFDKSYFLEGLSDYVKGAITP